MIVNQDLLINQYHMADTPYKKGWKIDIVISLGNPNAIHIFIKFDKENKIIYRGILIKMI